MKKKIVYLDNAATTPLDESVKKELRGYLNSEVIGNPSSRHFAGIRISRRLESFKKQVCALLGITNKFHSSNVIFTSGATEGNNLCIQGWCKKIREKTSDRLQIVVGNMEHDCVRQAVQAVASNFNFAVATSKLTKDGSLDLDHFNSILTKETVLVCQMAVNNQFGTIYDLLQVAKSMQLKCPEALLHVDAVQAIGKIPFNIQVLSNHIQTAVTFSAHKLHGPKGVGCVVYDENCNLKKHLEIIPLVFGGGQENGLRSGTENVMGIVGMCKALEIGCGLVHEMPTHYKNLFQTFLGEMEKWKETLCHVVTEKESCFAIFSLYIPGIAAEIVFNELSKRGVYVSVGSACQTREKKLSPTIVNRLGVEKARNVIRISFSKMTTKENVVFAVKTLYQVLNELIVKKDPIVMEEKPKVVVNHKKQTQKKKRKEKPLFVSDNPLEQGPSRILIREGELALKKKNRKFFERQLAMNVKNVVRVICPCQVESRDRRIYVTPKNEKDIKLVGSLAKRILQVFGISSISLCYRVASEIESIERATVMIAKEKLKIFKGKVKFRITTKRSWKRFPMLSNDISRQVGAAVYNVDPSRFVVNLKNFDLEFGIDIRPEASYIYCEKIKGLGGMPVGTAGKGVVLLSGGIDSPTASYLMMKRGMSLNFASFFSFPYTSQKYNDKIKKIVERLAYFHQTPGRLFLLPFTKIQELIRDEAPEEYRTVLYRRSMNFVALKVLKKTHSKCLITGESLGQVASQTIQNITSIRNAAGNTPILRPLIGMDKEEIIKIAKDVGTFEISCIPENDTCTLFQPKSPLIFSKLEEVIAVEAKLMDKLRILYAESLQEARIFKITTDILSQKID